MWTEHLQSGCLHHWPHVKLFCEQLSLDCSVLVIHMENLCQEFDSRFQVFGHIEPIGTFFFNPFNNATAVMISNVFGVPQGNFELEILTLQSDQHLNAWMHKNHFWSFADASRYPHLRDIALRLNLSL